ncbi:hypothetical protein PILCRDRAFT_816438, partial [Piloderma croceum F 1598]
MTKILQVAQSTTHHARTAERELKERRDVPLAPTCHKLTLVLSRNISPVFLQGCTLMDAKL